MGFASSDVNLAFRALKWEPGKTIDVQGAKTKNVLYFQGCEYINDKLLPYYVENFSSKTGGKPEVEIVNTVFKEYKGNPDYLHAEDISDSLQVVQSVVNSRGTWIDEVRILPIKKEGGKIYLLSKFTFRILLKEEVPEKKSQILWKTSSVLKSGKWIKIKTTKKGIHRIPFSLLQDWGFSDPQQVKIYGNAGYIVPEDMSTVGDDDPDQMSTWIGKDADGNDCLFFYSTGSTKWSWDPSFREFTHTTNIYANASYFFLTDNAAPRNDVVKFSPEEKNANVTIHAFDDYSLHEVEKYNLIKSGKQWFGERFIHGTNTSFDINCPGRQAGSSVKIRIDAAGRSSSNSSMNITVNGANEPPIGFDPVNTGEQTALYADETNQVITTNQPGDEFVVNLLYKAYDTSGSVNRSAEAWLDYIRVNYRRDLIYTGPEMYFRDVQSVGAGKVGGFVIGNAGENVRVFDITDINNIGEVPLDFQGDSVSFKRQTDALREYVIFTPATNFPEPVKVGDVPNQNLHALSTPEMIIITHPDFYDVANELADFHRNNDGMSVEVVKTSEVYNEFSSGMPDASGIRNFIRMLYTRDENKLKYVLLFGDGSYDNRNITGVNKNFVPTYQSQNSLSPTGSFVSDDYYVLLDEGETVYNGAVDLGIGRIPASTVYEAQVVLNKILDYNSPQALGSWRNVVCFIADDGDGNLHMMDSEQLANQVNSQYGAFVTSKIYFDSYHRVTTPAGEQYPEVTAAINERVKEGVLILNYVGHANERYLADEHVLDVSNISSWSNENNLPIFVTATCEFSRFDDDDTSAGEYVLLNPNGGGIGLFSTTRVVYAYSNFILSQSFYNHVFEQDKNGNHYRMGDIIRLAKIGAGTSTNKRNFTLLADPALRLSYPEYQVITSTINSKDATSAADTIKALSKITITGYIADYNGNKLSDFNGEITPTVYDKAFMLNTLGNGGGQPMSFKVQDNVIYKGLASVTNGEFSFSFIVPKDISYKLGNGKIIYYAQNSKDDAHGSFENFLIGGSDQNAFPDNTGPEVRLYLNDESFVSGDKTSKNPLLLAYVSDENGINTVGTGIGHDITAVIDDDMANAYILNSYYQANVDDYKGGKIEFPLKNLSEGIHTLKLKVWDVANNSTEAEIKFVVTGDFYISEVSNYPNPVTDYTFFRFTQNQPDASFNGMIEIFDTNGRIIDSFTTIISTNGTESNPIRWDVSHARVPVRSGTYIYRISIKSADGALTWKSGRMSVVR